jgi:hypothetical protein
VPLVYAAGYELLEEGEDALRPGWVASTYLRRGWAVANPATPAPGEAWPGENPLSRLVNLDVAFLQIARSQPFVDDARVLITGSSAGGWLAYMLAAESFPVLGCAPDIGIVNLAYNLAYFVRNDVPAVPGIALTSAVLARQVVQALGDDFDAPSWAALSPVTHAGEITCPVHAFCSTADVLTPLEEVTAETTPPDRAASRRASHSRRPRSARGRCVWQTWSRGSTWCACPSRRVRRTTTSSGCSTRSCDRS